MADKLLVIDRMFVFASVDDDGEGVAAMRTPTGWMPMIGADTTRVEALRPYADSLVKVSRQPINLLEFNNRVLIETFMP